MPRLAKDGAVGVDGQTAADYYVGKEESHMLTRSVREGGRPQNLASG